MSYYSAYDGLKQWFAFSYFEGVDFSPRHAAGIHMASAAVAGAITDVCTNPLWVARTRLQLVVQVQRYVT
jgi:hypothetical protein